MITRPPNHRCEARNQQENAPDKAPKRQRRRNSMASPRALPIDDPLCAHPPDLRRRRCKRARQRHSWLGYGEDRAAIRVALAADGFLLHDAADAKDGLQVARSSVLDSILVDCVLADAEGREVLDSLRKPGGTLPSRLMMLQEPERWISRPGRRKLTRSIMSKKGRSGDGAALSPADTDPDQRRLL
jgi:CheY-like chemotaxis protein